VVTQLFCGTLNIFGRGDCSSCAHQCVFVRVTVLWDKGEVDERGRTAGAHSALWFHQQSPFAAANGYAKLAGANSFCLHADGCDRGCVLVNWRFLISQLRAVCQLFNFLQHSLHQHSFYCTRWSINHIKWVSICSSQERIFLYLNEAPWSWVATFKHLMERVMLNRSKIVCLPAGF
jgi:hypothetical protein